MNLVWLTDIHLEFLPPNLASQFVEKVTESKPDAIVITGDISTADRLEFHLKLLARLLPCPVYFVLGNHDYYRGSFAEVDALVRQTCQDHSNLIELGHGEVIALGAKTALIGHRGWADGRAGSGSRTPIRLNDHHFIAELRASTSSELFKVLNDLGEKSATYIREIMPQAFTTADHVYLATHVPPFTEAALYEGKPSAPDFAPHFVNMAWGHALLDLAQMYPHKRCTVLCGHTHHAARYAPLPNLTVQVAGAIYREPQIAGMFNISKNDESN